MLRLPVPNPPCLAQMAAASGVARYLTNASIAGLSLKVTIRSPAISTEFAYRGLIEGHGNVLNPVPAFAFVDPAMTPPTKSPSNTIAAFDGDEKTFVTDWLKPVCSAPFVPR